MKGVCPYVHIGTPFGFSTERIPSQRGKTFLITGANVGLGYWTAHHLAAAGGHVVLGCRSAARCQAAIANITTHVFPLSQVL